jgi:hypothetical protein
MTKALIILFVLIAPIGCDSYQPPAAPSPNPTVPDVPTTAARFFGVVTNEEGAPLAGAMVVVAYSPDSSALQSVNTRTGSDGGYELQLAARQRQRADPSQCKRRLRVERAAGEAGICHRAELSAAPRADDRRRPSHQYHVRRGQLAMHRAANGGDLRVGSRPIP